MGIIAYPIDFQPDDDYATTPRVRRRLIIGLDSNNDPGLKFFTLTIPRHSSRRRILPPRRLPWAIARMPMRLRIASLRTQSGGNTSSFVATTTIGGTLFSKFRFTAAGAGSIYDTTSYRTVHAGACYAIEYTIHSSQIANYPSTYNLKPFSAAPLTAVLDRIVGTFQF